MFARRFVRLPSYLALRQQLSVGRRFARQRPAFCGLSNSSDAPFATPARGPHFPAHSNTPGFPPGLATGGLPPYCASADTPACRSATDADGCADQAQKVSCSTDTCADRAVLLPAIFTGAPIQARPPSADPKNASGGKKIHRPEPDISIWNQEVNPPTQWSLSFRQKKTHFLPPLTPLMSPPRVLPCDLPPRFGQLSKQSPPMPPPSAFLSESTRPIL